MYLERTRHGAPRLRWKKLVNGVLRSHELRGPIGSVEFLQDLEAALEGSRPAGRRAKPGTVAYLIEDYLGSSAYRRLSDSTRYRTRARLDWIKKTIGSAKYAQVQPHHVTALMEKKGDYIR